MMRIDTAIAPMCSDWLDAHYFPLCCHPRSVWFSGRLRMYGLVCVCVVFGGLCGACVVQRMRVETAMTEMHTYPLSLAVFTNPPPNSAQAGAADGPFC